jgi:hypothetical protein
LAANAWRNAREARQASGAPPAAWARGDDLDVDRVARAADRLELGRDRRDHRRRRGVVAGPVGRAGGAEEVHDLPARVAEHGAADDRLVDLAQVPVVGEHGPVVVGRARIPRVALRAHALHERLADVLVDAVLRRRGVDGDPVDLAPVGIVVGLAEQPGLRRPDPEEAVPRHASVARPYGPFARDVDVELDRVRLLGRHFGAEEADGKR